MEPTFPIMAFHDGTETAGDARARLVQRVRRYFDKIIVRTGLTTSHLFSLHAEQLHRDVVVTVFDEDIIGGSRVNAPSPHNIVEACCFDVLGYDRPVTYVLTMRDGDRFGRCTLLIDPRTFR